MLNHIVCREISVQRCHNVACFEAKGYRAEEANQMISSDIISMKIDGSSGEAL